MMASHELVKRACETYHYHAAIGMDVAEDSFCVFLQDMARPKVWDRNRILNITALTGAEIDQAMEFAASRSKSLGYSYVSASPFTSPAVIARLLYENYEERTPVIQMVLQGALATTRSPGIDLQPVLTEGDWQILHTLVRLDHEEGARTQGHILDVQVTRGIVEGYQKKAGPCQFFLAFSDDRPCAYGSAIVGPNGMGMVEDLFTLPAFRRQGVATTLISACVEHLRNGGCEDVLIGSLATEPPKALYRKLGFHPVCVTRSFLKQYPIAASG